MSKVTWKDFELVSEGKRIVLFGLAPNQNSFFLRYGNKYKIDYAIDNDKKKWGNCLSNYLECQIGEKVGNIQIDSPDILKKLEPNTIVFLIGGERYYPEIAKQLEDLDMQYIFPIAVMDREDTGDNWREKIESVKRRYAEECTSYEIEYRKIVVYLENYGDHGRQLTKKLLEQSDVCKIVWIVNYEMDAPDGVKIVYQRDWKSLIYEMETARIWIAESLIPDIFVKRKEQIYIQLKHWSSVTLKRFCFEDEQFISIEKCRKMADYNSLIMDYIFSGSDFDEASCRSGFHFNGEFIRTGSLRSDLLFDKNVGEHVKQKIGIDNVDKIVLYAPTFRNEEDEHYKAVNPRLSLNFDKLRNFLCKRFGGNWKVLVRWHPGAAAQDIDSEDNDVIDVSNYEIGEELLAAADVIITDYSSLMFEPAYIGKPVFLYAPDMDTYVNKERTLLIDYLELPFSVSRNNEELTRSIETFDEEEYSSGLKAFFGKYGVNEDGKACDRAATFVRHILC